MSREARRIAALVATLAVAGAMGVASATASAYENNVHVPFKNWVVSGTITPKKLNEPITLPPGSVFNGEAVFGLFTFTGKVTGSIFVPPFNATLKILGIPETVGITLTQAGTVEGFLAPSSQPAVDCPGATGSGSFCVTMSVPAKVNMEITVVGVLGIDVPTHCNTSEPITFNGVNSLTAKELLLQGPHFTGTTTLPTIICHGLDGPILGPVMTDLISGPENPYELGIAPPPA
jgi:hypothetical protein